jgi:hypothetical protein
MGEAKGRLIPFRSLLRLWRDGNGWRRRDKREEREVPGGDEGEDEEEGGGDDESMSMAEVDRLVQMYLSAQYYLNERCSYIFAFGMLFSKLRSMNPVRILASVRL